MRNIPRYLKSAILYSVSIILACGYPLTAFAEDAPASSQTTPATTTPTPSPAANNTSEKSPSTSSQSAPAKPKETYVYDAASGHWNTSKWQYDPTSKSYQPTPAPAPIAAPAPAKTNTPAAQSVVSPSPPQPTTKSSNQDATDSTTNTAVANALDSLAKTGDANVTRNSTAGGATSGNAAAAATVINNVNSSMTNNTNKEAAAFVSDVMGDVNGDIMLQPMLLKAMLEAGTTSNQTTNATNNTNITNDLTLKATSGNAAVTDNTKAGSATTGSANTVANVMNMLNSMIAANQSFVGTINIYGNLNGDILIAPDFIPQLLADNTSSTKQSAVVNANDTQSIVNNVALAAESGKALVGGNTSAGNATTGSADTNLVIFNLSGHEIVANNSLLVFVNVLGKWVGVIVDAPSGATAAAIGSGVSTNTVTAPSMVVNADNNTQITNNINLASQSGDATVTGNTLAGNATTGNATASANIANIANSQIGLSGWFGVLFINVFGTWTGSFGLNTSAGDPITLSRVYNARMSTHHKASTQVFKFVPRPQASTGSALPTVVAPTTRSPHHTITTVSTDNPYVVLASHDAAPKTDKSSDARHMNVPLTIASLLLIGASIFGLRRFLF